MNICIDCKHCEVEYFLNLFKIPVKEMYCKHSKDYIDYVTGEVYYRRCETVRQGRAVCDCWEQGGIKGFFQRLFRRS